MEKKYMSKDLFL